MIRQHLVLRDTGDLADTAAAAGFDVRCDQLESGRLEGMIEYVATSDARFFYDRFDRAICIHGSIPSDMVAFTLPATRSDSAIFCGEMMNPQSLGVIGPGDAYSYRAPANHGIFGSCVTVERLDFALHARSFIALSRALPRTASVQIPAYAAARLRRAMRFAIAPPGDPDLLLDQDTLEHAVEDRLLNALCIALTAGIPATTTRLSARNRWRCVRVARDYIELHLCEVLRMESLCQVTGVSERTLETAFRDVTGLTPAQFIKTRRLNAARHSLHAAEPSGTLIKSIALGSGFWHFGHFASDYKNHFGESPSVTLGGAGGTIARRDRYRSPTRSMTEVRTR